MKKYILILVLAITGCSSLKTTDQRAFQWNGDAAVAYLKANALARQRADAELNKMLQEFPAKTFAAGVISSWGAIAITPPVSEAFGNDFQLFVVGENCSAFAHCDVMSGIETKCRQVAEGACSRTSELRAQGVAIIFNQP